jgi:hypothetical protein
VPLVPITTPIEQPENPTFLKARAPTVPKDNADAVFTGTHVRDKLLTHDNGKCIKDANGQPK